MEPEKKWDFEFPTKPPTSFQRVQAAVNRATNNLKYGFDGVLTPMQMGPQVDKAKPLLEIEVKLTRLLNDGEITKFLFASLKAGRGLSTEVKRRKRITDDPRKKA